MSRPARASVIVLSHNRPCLLRDALGSVARQTCRDMEVIVVDNLSPRSRDVAEVVGEFPGFRLIANRANLGYTGGMNAGIRAARGQHLLLTEDDIVLGPDALATLADHCERDPRVGLAGGVMYNLSDSTVRCAGGRVRLGSRFELEVITDDPAESGSRAPYSVGYLPGAFLFGPRRIWESLGGFRERFFMYFEDVELCLRVARRGLSVQVVPAAKVWHFDPPSSVTTPGWLEVVKLRNLLALHLLHAPAGTLPGFLARYFGSEVVRSLIRGRRRGWHALRAFVESAVDLPAVLADRLRLTTTRSRSDHV